MNSFLLQLLPIDNVLKENLVELFLFVESPIEKGTTYIIRIGVLISSEEVSQVASVRINIIISFFLDHLIW